MDSRAIAAVAAALALLAPGCGEEATRAADEPAPVPTATATAGSTPTASATPTPTPPLATAPSAPEPPPEGSDDEDGPAGSGGGAEAGGTGGPETAPGGAGDETPARVTRGLTVATGGLTPAEVRVPAYLALELTVRNRSSRPVSLALSGPSSAQGPVVGAGGIRRWSLGGLRPGRYVVSAGAAGESVLLARP